MISISYFLKRKLLLFKGVPNKAIGSLFFRSLKVIPNLLPMRLCSHRLLTPTLTTLHGVFYSREAVIFRVQWVTSFSFTPNT